MKTPKKGSLIIIGGHEDREGERVILSEVSRRARGDAKLVIVTVATQFPEDVARGYRRAFADLGVARVEVLDIRSRRDAYSEENVAKARGAAVIFFTGGDQLRITSLLASSPVHQCFAEVYDEEGATIAGTSAGAAAMPETMLVSGPSHRSNEVSAINMAPGLGLIRGVVIDSHFAERGRIGRLLGAVAQHPGNLGIGIDEDTALVYDGASTLSVLGSGAVYVLDGEGISYSSLWEKEPRGILDLHDVRLHVLGSSGVFDLSRRRPVTPVESG